MSFRTKQRILIAVAIGLVLALLLFYRFFTETLIGVLLLVAWFGGYWILNLLWWRCPHCNAYLWKLSTFAEYCPHCGKKLEE